MSKFIDVDEQFVKMFWRNFDPVMMREEYLFRRKKFLILHNLKLTQFNYRKKKNDLNIEYIECFEEYYREKNKEFIMKVSKQSWIFKKLLSELRI